MIKTNPTIKVYTELSPSEFIPLLIPVDCNFYLMKNIGPDKWYMRSDPTDPLTEDSIDPGGSESLSGAVGSASLNCSYRYANGDTLYYVKCTGPLVGKFWR